MREGKDGQPQSQVFSYQYDALGRRIAKTDCFGQRSRGRGCGCCRKAGASRPVPTSTSQAATCRWRVSTVQAP
ncbi:hypothetical protein LJR129_000293 [Acidovorax sp. LjRoot129]